MIRCFSRRGPFPERDDDMSKQRRCALCGGGDAVLDAVVSITIDEALPTGDVNEVEIDHLFAFCEKCGESQPGDIPARLLALALTEELAPVEDAEVVRLHRNRKRPAEPGDPTEH